MKEYTGYVNPFIGTGGPGHTHPGAMLPHGMIQPGPETKGKKNIKAHYDGVNADQQAKDSQLIQYTLPENSNKLSINLCRGGGYIGIINIE